MALVTVSGDRIHYRVHHGALRTGCPPLVLVHRAGGHIAWWPGELRRLPGHTVYALDLPGHGNSGGAAGDIGMYAEVVQGFASALDLPPYILAGHSMGGAVAMEVALRFPGKLKGLILFSTGAHLPVNPQLLQGLREDFAATTGLLARWTHAPKTDPNLLRLYARRLRDLPRETTLSDFIACGNFNRQADVASITLPALILCGDVDVMTPLAQSRFLQSQIAGSELVTLHGAGHMAMIERPGECAAAVLGFFERQGC